MNTTTTRRLASVLTIAATAVVGLVGARAINDNDTSSADVDGDDPVAAVLIEGELDDVQQPIPLLGPISDAGPDLGAGGGDGASGEGASGASPVIGGVFGPALEIPEGDPDPAGVAFTDPPLFYDAIEGISRLRERAFDSCAGPEPGTLPVPIGACPEGYGGTLLALHLVPEPSMWGVDGARIACPDAPTTAVTVYSATPLEALVVKWRPYGTSLEYEQLPTIEPATPAADRSAWEARFELEEFSLADFGYLAHCAIPVVRDQNVAYELHLTARDIFGRTFENVSVLPDATPEGRPPTVVQISETEAVAQMTAWTHEGGLVTVGVFPFGDIRSESTPEFPGDCDLGARGTIDPSDIHMRDGSHPSPGGVYDPDFTRKAVTSIPLSPGEFALVCVTIYETDNTLRPLATDSFVVQGPEVVLPVVRLIRVAFTEPRSVAASEQLSIRMGTPADDCGPAWRLDTGLRGSELINHVWTCVGMGVPTTELTPRNLYVAISRIHEGRLLSQASAIELDEFYTDADSINVPIPPNASRICGRMDGDGRRCEQPGEGEAHLIVTYERVGTGSGRVWPWGNTDDRAAEPLAGEPRLQLLSGEVTNSDDWHSVAISLSLGSDRPVTLESVRVIANELPYDSEPECGIERVIEVGSGPATEFEVATTICAGLGHSVIAVYSDEAGVVYERLAGQTGLLAETSGAVVHVEFLGGDAPTFGWLYRFGVTLETSSPSGGGLSGPTAPAGERCRSLDETVGEFPFRDLTVIGSTLHVSVSGRITVTGETDCPLSGGGAFDFSFAGTMTLDALRIGAPVSTSADGTARRQFSFIDRDNPLLQLRVSVEGEFQLGDLFISGS